MNDTQRDTVAERDGRVRIGALRLLSRLHPHALGVAAGSLAALALVLATTVLLLRQGDVVGPHLALLGQYLPGYTVSWPGAVVGAIYFFGLGYAFAAAFAILRNIAVAVYLRFAWSRLQHHVASDLLDRMV